MKINFIIFYCIVCIGITNGNCQQRTSHELQDSVYKKYVKNGAFNCSLFSQQRARFIDTAISITPDNPYLWQQRAMPLFKQGKYETGMSFLDKAVELDPLTYLDYRAFIKCIFSKRYSEAIIDFTNAEKLKPGANVMDHSYDFYIGLCYLQLNKFDEAKKCFEKSIETQFKKNGEEYVHYLDQFYLAITLYELEDYANAVNTFNKVLFKYEHFSDAKYYKARCLKKLDRMDESSLLLVSALSDIKAGNTVNEDNSIYEKYPYQISLYYFGK